jgi:hypothetical protein
VRKTFDARRLKLLVTKAIPAFHYSGAHKTTRSAQQCCFGFTSSSHTTMQAPSFRVITDATFESISGLTSSADDGVKRVFFLDAEGWKWRQSADSCAHRTRSR